MFKLAKRLVTTPKDKPRSHSAYALMENGPMRKESIGFVIFKRLMRTYNTEYIDNADKELILSAMTGNYQTEVESAWQAFLAEIGEEDD